MTTEDRFAVVPLWLLTNREVKHLAVRLYALLAARYADREDHTCYPSRAALAADLGVARSTIDVALAQLKRVGAVTATQRRNAAGDLTSNLYTIIFNPSTVRTNGSSARRATLTGNTDDMLNGHDGNGRPANRSVNQNHLNQNHLNEEPVSGVEIIPNAPTEPTRTPAPVTVRGKGPIFKGQRLIVFGWQLDDLTRMLGPHTEAFDLCAWLTALDAHAIASACVIPQRDGGAWLQAQTLAEARRRGLPLAVAPPVPAAGKLTSRMASMIANALNGSGE
jgi:hypothetical protein